MNDEERLEDIRKTQKKLYDEFERGKDEVWDFMVDTVERIHEEERKLLEKWK